MPVSEEFKAYFSSDDSEAYVLTGPLPTLSLKEEPEPQDAPVYLDLETGQGYYPEGVSSQKAKEAAEYAKVQASSDVSVHLRQDTDSWMREFSGLFGVDDVGGFWSVDMDERNHRNNRF